MSEQATATGDQAAAGPAGAGRSTAAKAPTPERLALAVRLVRVIELCPGLGAGQLARSAEAAGLVLGQRWSARRVRELIWLARSELGVAVIATARGGYRLAASIREAEDYAAVMDRMALDYHAIASRVRQAAGRVLGGQGELAIEPHAGQSPAGRHGPPSGLG